MKLTFFSLFILCEEIHVVVFDKEAKVSLMRHAKISLELSELLGFDVDLITEGTLLSFAERTANNDKILIYERAS